VTVTSSGATVVESLPVTRATPAEPTEGAVAASAPPAGTTAANDEAAAKTANAVIASALARRAAFAVGTDL
jgi:hypothetical protein